MSLAIRKVRGKTNQRQWQLDSAHVVWAVGSLCALNRIPFDAELLLKQFPPPYTTDTLIHAVRVLGFRIKLKVCDASILGEVATPCLALLASDSGSQVDVASSEVSSETSPPLPGARLGLITDVSPERVQLFEAGSNTPVEVPVDLFSRRYLGIIFLVARKRPPVLDPDVVDSAPRFGFRWFIPALLKHKKVWRDVLLASLVIQLLALGTPLFTQIVIDKVVVHRTESTLLVIAVGMAVFMI